jgi:hypothetical protein
MIRKLAILLVYPLYLANFGCQSQVRSPLEGLWKTQDQQDSLLIYAVGKKSPALIVSSARKGLSLSYKWNLSHDSLIYRPLSFPNTRFYLTVNLQQGILQSWGKFSGLYFKTSNSAGSNSMEMPAEPTSFFDFSTTNFYAGIKYDLTPKTGLFFIINKEFIVRHKLDSIHVEKYYTNINQYGTDTYKEYDWIYYFNKKGNITKFTVIPFKNDRTFETGKTVSWLYGYKDGQGEILQTLSIGDKVVRYDEDGWEVDALDQKIVPRFLPSWTYYPDSKLPRTATDHERFGDPAFEYFYDAKKQLSKVSFTDPSTPGILEQSATFLYDNNGVLLKIIETRRK